MCLLHKHYFTHVILCDHIVECTYSLDILTVPPLYGLFQHVEKFRAGNKLRHLLRHFPGRHLKYKAPVIKMQRKIFQASCIRDHISVIIVLKFIDAVYIDFRYTSVLEETLFIIHSVSVEKLDRIIRMHGPLVYLYLLFGEFSHTV